MGVGICPCLGLEFSNSFGPLPLEFRLVPLPFTLDLVFEIGQRSFTRMVAQERGHDLQGLRELLVPLQLTRAPRDVSYGLLMLPRCLFGEQRIASLQKTGVAR